MSEGDVCVTGNETWEGATLVWPEQAFGVDDSGEPDSHDWFQYV